MTTEHAGFDPLEHWPAFMAELKGRLDVGRATYGDTSFSRSSSELLVELEQEALDLAGWGFVLWERLRRLRAKCVAVEEGRGD